jgi:hypothetical protein
MNGCKEDILAMIENERIKMEEKEENDFVIIPTDDQNHRAVDYVKFLIGSNGNKINELRTTFPDILIQMPYPERGEEPIIRIGGLSKSDVDQVKNYFNDRIEIFRV